MNLAGRARRAAAAATVAALALAAPAGALPSQDAGEASGRVPAMAVIAQNLEVGPTGSFSVYLRVTDAPADSDVAVDIYDPIADAAALAASTTTDPTDARATFDPLPLADRERMHGPIRLNIEAILLCLLNGAFAHRRERERLIETEPNVLGDGHGFE